MAVQRREGDMDYDMTVMEEIHDMTETHEAMEPMAPVVIEDTEETSTPHGVHNVTVVHTTQSTIEHITTAQTIVNTTFDYFPPTPPPHDPEDHHDNECEDTNCGCNAEEMARWEIEMSEWKHDQNSKSFSFNIRMNNGMISNTYNQFGKWNSINGFMNTDRMKRSIIGSTTWITTQE